MFKSRSKIYDENSKIEYIEQLIQENQKIGLDELAKLLNITRDGVKYYINIMKNTIHMI